MATPAFAESPTSLSPEEAWREIIEQLNNGVNVQLAPGEKQEIPIPLSNGNTAYLEIGCESALQTRGSTTTTYSYSSNGNYIFYAKINGGMAGNYTHRVNFNVSAISPTCKFAITSANVEGQTPSVGMTNFSSGVTDIVNYDVGTSSYTHAYASFMSPVQSIPINVYDKVLMNSYQAGKIQFTIYYDFSPIG